MTTPLHCAHCERYLGKWIEPTRWQPGEADVADDVIQDDEGNYYCNADCMEQGTTEAA